MGQKYYTYPRDWLKVIGGDEPISTDVDQLEYRLDKQIIPAACQGNNINGGDTISFIPFAVFLQILNCHKVLHLSWKSFVVFCDALLVETARLSTDHVGLDVVCNIARGVRLVEVLHFEWVLDTGVLDLHENAH